MRRKSQLGHWISKWEKKKKSDMIKKKGFQMGAKLAKTDPTQDEYLPGIQPDNM
jgi:hypothetical protein